jgi:lipopolysaccharide/colanic/teichoic acid biosynthesis glycosyltransferase
MLLAGGATCLPRRDTTVFAKLVRGLQKLLQRSPLPAAEGLLLPEQVRRLLERERARAERSGEPLALLTFAAPRGRLLAAEVHTLAGALHARLRVTDEAGWLDRRQVCAVLPGTTTEGAWRVSDDIRARLSMTGLEVVTSVYTFQGDEDDADDDTQMDMQVEEPRPTVPLQSLFLRAVPLWKRGLDIAGAICGLVLLLPLVTFIAAAIKLSSRGPVLFRQWRSGRGGKPFLMYKFRTMVTDAEVRKQALLPLNERDGPAFKIKDDPRVTRLGRFLRATSLDELPQLWNVLKGDMSLVGPRPLPCHETAACSAWQRRRLDVTPGLTCIWQVRARGGITFAEWVRMDVRYIRSRSLWQDLKLLALTLPAILLRRGAH